MHTSDQLHPYSIVGSDHICMEISQAPPHHKCRGDGGQASPQGLHLPARVCSRAVLSHQTPLRPPKSLRRSPHHLQPLPERPKASTVSAEVPTPSAAPPRTPQGLHSLCGGPLTICSPSPNPPRPPSAWLRSSHVMQSLALHPKDLCSPCQGPLSACPSSKLQWASASLCQISRRSVGRSVVASYCFWTWENKLYTVLEEKGSKTWETRHEGWAQRCTVIMGDHQVLHLSSRKDSLGGRA
jgi:hypothetical protein